MKARWLIGAAAGAVGFTGSAFAQDFKQGAPQQLPAQPSAAPIPPLPAVTDNPALVAEVLNGLVFVPGARYLAGERGGKVGGVEVVRIQPGQPGVDLDVIDNAEFRALAQTQLGKRATLGSLEAFAQDVVRYYRAKGYPLVDVRIPASQDDPRVTGIVVLTVTEFRVGTVEVRGAKIIDGAVVLTPTLQWFNPKNVRSAMRFKRGSRIKEDRIVEDLDFLARNPFRRTDLIYRKADEPGYTDITLRVAERKPWRVYVGFENTGTPTTQRERISAGFNLANLWDQSHEFSYQFTSSIDLLDKRPGNPDPSFISHSFTYQAPIDWRLFGLHDSLLLFGTYQRATPRLTSPTPGLSLSQIGKSYQLSGRYAMQLPAGDKSKQSLTLGADWKRTNNNLLFDVLAIGGVTEIYQGVIEYRGDFDWKIGEIEGLTPEALASGTKITLSIANTTVLSPGGIGPKNTDFAFQPSLPGALVDRSGTPFAKARYGYNRFTVAPSVEWESHVIARARATWQIATDNLLPTEQLASAGPGSVRGYDPNSIIGSNGYTLSAELLSPVLPTPLPRYGYAKTDKRYGTAADGPLGRARVGVFFDYGSVSDPTTIAGTLKRRKGMATGLTGDYTAWGGRFSLHADYGWQLKEAPGATKKGELGFITATLGF